MLVFNVEGQTLGVIQKPGNAHCTGFWSCQPLRIDGGSGLGLAVISKMNIQLWKRKSNCNGVVGWVLMHNTIQLEGMFPREMPRDDNRVLLVGYDEDTNVVVLSTRIGRFMLQLESMQIRKISGRMENGNRLMEFYPYTNFYYTPGRVIAGGDGGAENVKKYLGFSSVCRDAVMLCCGFFCFCMLSSLMWLMLKSMPCVVSRFFRPA
ncbi:uncharacterized protein LOC124652149 [Lolium rigidum]|uniref:uncharacterized protein LOC124652149 n=1 Tax=Lolium rigidum TaxID=89674 RepID=UPI001F5D96A0|nr:uncharacterized protein LOC124652149 [Lolium rigidum]